MSQYVHVSADNPNDITGGAGCIFAGETRSEDCEGPFLIFPIAEMANNKSPHVVLCTHHLGEANDALAQYNLEVGEPITVPDSDIEELTTPTIADESEVPEV